MSLQVVSALLYIHSRKIMHRGASVLFLGLAVSATYTRCAGHSSTGPFLLQQQQVVSCTSSIMH